MADDRKNALAALRAAAAKREAEAAAEAAGKAGARQSALDALRRSAPKAGTDGAAEGGTEGGTEGGAAGGDKRAALDALRKAAPQERPDSAGSDAAGSDATSPDATSPDTGRAALDALRAALDALRAQAPDPGNGDDPLAGLDDLLDDGPPAGAGAATETADAAEDPLAGLDDLLAGEDSPPAPTDRAGTPGDPLADLDALLDDGGAGAALDPDPGPDPAASPAADPIPDPIPDPAAAPAAALPPQAPFGRLDAPRPDRAALHRPRFRMAVFGDFTGRAAAGRMAVGAALAGRRAIRLDVDTLDDVIAGFATTLRLPVTTQDGQESVIEVPLRGIDDLHPDELYERLPLFSELAGLRGQLTAAATSAKAVERLTGWGLSDGTGLKTRRRSAGSEMPADRKLSDFQALIGGPAPGHAAGDRAPAAAAERLVAGIVGPHVVAAPDPQARALVAAVDDALSSAMRLILHHPEFRALEAQWRSLDLLARRIETGDDIEIVLFDVSAEELAADLAADEDLARSGLYRLLMEAALPEDQGGGGAGGFSALFGLYTFEETPPHAEILARIARIAAHVDAPFLAALSPACLDTALRDRHPLTDRAWRALRALPEAGWLGLALPRFLLRHPYGARTDPVDAFGFEEFTPQEGLRGLLWANPAVAVAVLMAATRSTAKQVAAMDLGSVMTLDDMPFHHVTDAHGDQVALPCTERNLTMESLEGTVTRGLMALVSPRGRDAVRLASFQSLAGAQLLGPWAAEVPAASAAASAAAAAPAAAGVVGIGGLDLEMTMPVPEGAAPEETAAAGDGLDDLDALLAGFEDSAETAGAGTDPDEIDAELAALLEGL